MNQERMAQIDRASRTGRQFNLAIFRGAVTSSRELPERRASFAVGQQLPRNGGMRTLPDSRGRIVGTDIREQEEHEQCPSAALHVGTPLHEIRIVVAKTHIDMPAIITRGFW